MKKAVLILFLLALSNIAFSTPISITSYDIESTHTSGSGGWVHSYSGTITPISGTVAK